MATYIRALQRVYEMCRDGVSSEDLTLSQKRLADVLTRQGRLTCTRVKLGWIYEQADAPSRGTLLPALLWESLPDSPPF